MAGGCRRLAIAIVCAGLWADPARAGDSPARGSLPLRIVCFNVENLAAPGERTTLTRFRFEPARRRHVEHVAAVVETLVPDILVMPEVVSRDGVEAVVQVLHEKGLRDYRGFHVDGRDRFSGFDVAVLSRFDPDEIAGRKIHIFVPAQAGRTGRRSDDREASQSGPPDDWMRRSFSHTDALGKVRHEEAVLQRHAVTFFTVHGRKLGVLGLHLKSNPSDPASNAQREAETAIAREIIRREIVARGYTPIVLGDLNDYDPDIPMADSGRRTRTGVLRGLKDYDDTVDGDELVNAARHIPRIADRYSSHWDVNENGAADGDDVFSMLDHVLLHRDVAPAITRAFICHAIDLDISDHFPVVVDLDLAKLPAE